MKIPLRFWILNGIFISVTGPLSHELRIEAILTLLFCSANASRSSLQTLSVISVVCRVLYCKGGTDDPLLSLSAELEDDRDRLRSLFLWNKYFFIYIRKRDQDFNSSFNSSAHTLTES